MDGIKKVEVTLKVISPLVTAGADKEKLEFRVTELKSLLRTTFRELYYFKDRKEMKEKEDFFFGNMDRKAPVSIILKGIEPKADVKKSLLPHKIKSGRSCYSYGEEIRLCFVDRNKIENKDINFLEFYIELLIQSSIIGSLGSRSRKGFGSFKVKKVEGLDKYHISESLDESIEKITNSKFDNSNYKNCSIRLETKDFKKEDKLIELVHRKIGENKLLEYPYIKRIKLIPLNKGIDKTLESISRLTHDRLGHYKLGSTKEAFSKADINVLGQHKSGIRKVLRFASPIHVSFFADGKNNIYLVIKQLNYDYFLNELDKELRNNKILSKEVSKEYVNAFVKRLIEIGGEK